MIFFSAFFQHNMGYLNMFAAAMSHYIIKRIRKCETKFFNIFAISQQRLLSSHVQAKASGETQSEAAFCGNNNSN